MSDPGDLTVELRRRIEGIGSRQAGASEQFASSRPVILEALLWTAAALILWLAAVVFI